MLIKNYSHYVMELLLSGMLSLIGLLSIALFIGAFVALVLIKANTSKLRLPLFWGLLLVAIGLQVTAFYSAIYEFDEHPETLNFAALPAGEPTCGTGWTTWTKAGYGIGNPCPSGCFRGNVIHKQLRMDGFPPWPAYRRELQCWKRAE